MKELVKMVLIFSFPNYSYSQINLVPNPSFEDTIYCPDGGLGGISYAYGWFSCGDSVSSPDYFFDCGQYPMVPDNLIGYQWPATGVAYAGIITFNNGYQQGKEYIGTKFSSPLIIGQKYYVSLKVSFDVNEYFLAYAANKTGILFSTKKYSISSPVPVNNFAHIYTDSIITDTINWTIISNTFISDSAYQYINIGNFFNDSNTDTLRIQVPSMWDDTAAYYYIDDVCVSQDSNECDFLNYYSVVLSEKKMLIYPNPVKTQLNILINNRNSFQETREVSIYNNMYDKMYFKKFQGNNLFIDVSMLTDGIYFIVIKSNNETFYEKIIKNNF